MRMVLINFQDNKKKGKTMLKQFENYLIARKYRQVSANNSLSTVFDYCYRISKICEREGITIEKLATEITKYLEEYSATGNKANLGRMSHFSYFYALKQFRKFVLISRFGNV